MYVHSLCMSIIILTIQFLNLCARFHLNSSKIMKKKKKKKKGINIFR